jgi:hypothetical protein
VIPKGNGITVKKEKTEGDYEKAQYIYIYIKFDDKLATH